MVGYDGFFRLNYGKIYRRLTHPTIYCRMGKLLRFMNQNQKIRPILPTKERVKIITKILSYLCDISSNF
jgi:hypothetical protein